MKWTIEKENSGMMIRDYVKDVQHFSRRMLIAVKKEGKILVNGQPENVRYALAAGDVLEIQFPKEEIGACMKAEAMDLSIVYEDEAVMVVEKQAGIATIPSLHHPSGTIANGILYYYKQSQIPYTVHVVTRLDRDTSGLVLIAKHRYSHSLLSSAQKLGEIKRKYKAIVEGELKEETGTIDAPIDRKEDSIIERAVKESGKRAVTHFNRIKATADYSYVEIELETGRTHQIRVHFSHINHPLIGDDLYGGSTASLARHALHCDFLSFEHPFTKERLIFQSELPDDMKAIVNQM